MKNIARMSICCIHQASQPCIYNIHPVVVAPKRNDPCTAMCMHLWIECKQEFGASRYKVVLGATSICSICRYLKYSIPGEWRNAALLKDALSIPQCMWPAPLLINTVPSVVNSLLSKMI